MTGIVWGCGEKKENPVGFFLGQQKDPSWNPQSLELASPAEVEVYQPSGLILNQHLPVGKWIGVGGVTAGEIRSYIRFGQLPDTSLSFDTVRLELSYDVVLHNSPVRVLLSKASSAWWEIHPVWPPPEPADSETLRTVGIADEGGLTTATFSLPDSLVRNWMADSTQNNGFLLQLADQSARGVARFFSSRTLSIIEGGNTIVRRPRLLFAKGESDTAAAYATESGYLVEPAPTPRPPADNFTFGGPFGLRLLAKYEIPDSLLGVVAHSAVGTFEITSVGEPLESDSGDVELTVFTVTSPWTAGQVNPATLTVDEERPVGDTDVAQGDQSFDTDVTAIFQDWFAQEQSNYGFELRWAYYDTASIALTPDLAGTTVKIYFTPVPKEFE
jgi:hypothetical protein